MPKPVKPAAEKPKPAPAAVPDITTTTSAAPLEDKPPVMSVRRKMMSKLPEEMASVSAETDAAPKKIVIKPLADEEERKSEEKISFKVEAIKKRAYRKGSGEADSPESKKQKPDHSKSDRIKDKDKTERKSQSKTSESKSKAMSKKIVIDEDAALTSTEAKRREERLASMQQQERQREEARKVLLFFFINQLCLKQNLKSLSCCSDRYRKSWAKVY